MELKKVPEQIGVNPTCFIWLISRWILLLGAHIDCVLFFIPFEDKGSIRAMLLHQAWWKNWYPHEPCFHSATVSQRGRQAQFCSWQNSNNWKPFWGKRTIFFYFSIFFFYGTHIGTFFSPRQLGYHLAFLFRIPLHVLARSFQFTRRDRHNSSHYMKSTCEER